MLGAERGGPSIIWGSQAALARSDADPHCRPLGRQPAHAQTSAHVYALQALLQPEAAGSRRAAGRLALATLGRPDTHSSRPRAPSKCPQANPLTRSTQATRSRRLAAPPNNPYYPAPPPLQVVIVDEATGREKERSRWQAGLHPALEVKHGLRPGPDHSNMASVTYQCLFKYYRKLAGMTVGGVWWGCQEVLQAGRHFGKRNTSKPSLCICACQGDPPAPCQCALAARQRA